MATPGRHHNDECLHLSSATPVKLASKLLLGIVVSQNQRSPALPKLSWVSRNDTSKEGTTLMKLSSLVQELDRVFT